ncbi:hypothetical protein Lal_00011353 [Lupinus albus]|uniref:Uncharacterized protein n=1 Tax=Lupinus albus TaxID=3870 RepID=A0A6A4PHC6_LUPAL|nr:hypothetical protein Lalb_Chr13g0291271 [Lupinus albus]KAF1888579.1 hypothetical protein Lal_00011353 [Lupinus albus]
MNTHIDLNSPQQSKNSSKHFWSAPSVFTNKLQKWMQKHKMKKHNNNETISTTFPVQNPISNYGLRKLSCDTDPRFSLDIGPMSFENDPMYSFDEPRASLDGYLIGRTMVPRMHTMLSLVEDAPMHVLRTDSQIPVEEPTNFDDDNVPGGSAQTREYYDLSFRKRKSIDRSNSIKKTAAAVVNEMVELKSSSIVNANANANASKLGGFVDCDLRPNSLRDDCCLETHTTELGFKDSSSVIGNGDSKGSKKSRRWSKAWNIWGFINRQSGNKDEDRYSRANKGARHSFSESWQNLRGDHNGNRDCKGAFDGKLLRSNSSVSHRNGGNLGGSFGIVRRNGSESNEHGKKAKNEFVLERNKSAKYSPKNIDNGLLQLYLTPTRSSHRNGSVKTSNKAHSIPRTLHPLY